MRGASGTKAVGAVPEVSLEDRLQHQQGGGLHHPIPDCRNPQRAPSAIRLGDGDASYRQRPVGLLAKLFVKFVHELPGAALRVDDLVDRHSVDPFRTVVGADLFPRGRQYVSPIDPIVQSVESELRLLLGLSVELRPQEREFLRERAVLHPAG
jgi:hypothetical protein